MTHSTLWPHCMRKEQDLKEPVENEKTTPGGIFDRPGGFIFSESTKWDTLMVLDRQHVEVVCRLDKGAPLLLLSYLLGKKGSCHMAMH